MISGLPFQVTNGCPVFFSEEAKEAFSCFKENQVVIGNFKGSTKKRSLTQLRLYWACCNYIAMNVPEYPFGHNHYEDYIRWSKKELVDKQIRKALHFVDDTLTVRIDKNTFEFHYRSIAMENLKHLEACNYFDRALDLLAIRIGITKEELVSNVKALMGKI